MSAGDSYLQERRNALDISGSLTAVAATDDQTLVTVRNTSTTIYIQRVVVYITTDAAQSWAFTDSNGTPVPVCKVTTSPGVDTRWDFDFGPKGMPLTQGKNFLLNMSAAGLAGTVNWYGYSRLTAPMAQGTTN
jgi:hypothetical protein